MFRPLLIVGTVLLSALLLRAEDGHFGENLRTNQVIAGEKVSRHWSEITGREVAAEGIAWGVHAKGLGEHVLLANAKVYVRGEHFDKAGLNGKLVRVVGTLRKEHIAKAPQGVQGYGERFDYFTIDVERVEAIDRVRTVWLTEVEQNSRD